MVKTEFRRSRGRGVSSRDAGIVRCACIHERPGRRRADRMTTSAGPLFVRAGWCASGIATDGATRRWTGPRVSSRAQRS